MTDEGMSRVQKLAVFRQTILPTTRLILSLLVMWILIFDNPEERFLLLLAIGGWLFVIVDSVFTGILDAQNERRRQLQAEIDQVKAEYIRKLEGERPR